MENITQMSSSKFPSNRQKISQYLLKPIKCLKTVKFLDEKNMIAWLLGHLENTSFENVSRKVRVYQLKKKLRSCSR